MDLRRRRLLIARLFTTLCPKENLTNPRDVSITGKKILRIMETKQKGTATSTVKMKGKILNMRTLAAGAGPGGGNDNPILPGMVRTFLID